MVKPLDKRLKGIHHLAGRDHSTIEPARSRASAEGRNMPLSAAFRSASVVTSST
jgi:hypothetical protein